MINCANVNDVILVKELLGGCVFFEFMSLEYGKLVWKAGSQYCKVSNYRGRCQF